MTLAVPRVAAILTDIEGTTTPISFVRDTLFPFARANVQSFLHAHGDRPDVAAAIMEVSSLSAVNLRDIDGIVTCLRQWMDEDRKIQPLKTLQGLIWEEGYRTGQLKGVIYSDAVQALRAWSANGIRLAVYSSGSVLAQRFLFKTAPEGDLSRLFQNFFDTSVGPKREVRSYRAIAAALQLRESDILFLSDVSEELDAAAAVGMTTIQVVRSSDGTLASGRHASIATLAELEWSDRKRSAS